MSEIDTCQCANKYWNDHCIQCGKPTDHASLAARLQASEGEVDRVNVFREDLRSKFWEKDREIGQLRVRIAELEADAKRLDKLEELAQDYAVSFTYFSNRRIDLVIKNPDASILLACHSYQSLREAIDALQSAQPGSEKGEA